MIISHHAEAPSSLKPNVSVLFITQEELAEASGGLGELGGAHKAWREMMAEEEFEAKPKQTFLLRGVVGFLAPRLLIVGLGEQSALDVASLRDAGARAARAASKLKARVVSARAPEDAARLEPLALGIAQGAYDYADYRTLKENDYRGIEQLHLVNVSDEASAQLKDLGALTAAVSLARDLVNSPPQALLPGDDGRASAAARRAPSARVHDL